MLEWDKIDAAHALELMDSMEQSLVNNRDCKHHMIYKIRKRNTQSQLLSTKLKKIKSTVEKLNIESEVERKIIDEKQWCKGGGLEKRVEEVAQELVAEQTLTEVIVTTCGVI